MSAHPPPVPPDQQSPHAGPKADVTKAGPGEPRDPNLGEQGRQGNSKQNTTNKGLQQDR